VSGVLTKQAFGIWSRAPSRNGFVLRDVSEDVARKVGVKHVVESATGRGSIAGYTVVYERGKPPRGVAIVDIGDARAVVQSEDPAIVARMESVELCGATVQLGENHSYTL
jgi:acetyl-CoA C-acetyltransferase